MATFLLWMSPEPGHILPTVELATILTKRGHTVVYHTCGHIIDDLATLGLSAVSSFPNLSHEGVERSLRFRVRSTVDFEKHMQGQFANLADYYDYLRTDLFRAVENVRPDVILLDGIKDWRFLIGASDFYSSLQKRGRVGRICVHLRNVATSEFENARIPLIFLCPAAFELPHLVRSQAIYADASCFVGFKSFAESPPLQNSTSRLIYVSFGSQSSHYPGAARVIQQLLIAAKMEPNWHFLLNVHNPNPRWDLSRSLNVSITSTLSQPDVLRKASAMVCHGGLGSIKDCIYAAVPLLIIPQLWDQPLNAKRVVFHKLGMSLDASEVTAHALIENLRTIMFSTLFSHDLESMRVSFNVARKSQLAANACESLLRV